LGEPEFSVSVFCKARHYNDRYNAAQCACSNAETHHRLFTL
jgi:hypothetical protein